MHFAVSTSVATENSRATEIELISKTCTVDQTTTLEKQSDTELLDDSICSIQSKELGKAHSQLDHRSHKSLRPSEMASVNE